MDATVPQEKLVTMANQVAAFFRAYPEAEAMAGIGDHLRAFWTARMRSALLAGDGAGLDPLVVGALRSWPSAPSPVKKETSGPETLGALASDAG